MLLPADLMAAIKVRWRLEVTILALVLLAVLAWTAISPKNYIAVSSLLFDDRPLDPVQNAAVAQQDGVNALLTTQADVLQSEAIAAEVARGQGLGDAPGTIESWRSATGGTGDINSWIGRQLLTNVSAEPVRGSRVLQIRYQSSDPQVAALMANAFARAYLEARLRLETEPARTYSRWFEDRTREVRAKLEQAQQRLTDYQRKTGIVDGGAINAEASRLAELSSQLTGAEASAADLGARAGISASQSPDVQSSGVVQQLRAEIANKSAMISQMSATFGPNHPQRQAAEAELATLRSRLGMEIGTSTRAVQVASGSASSKEAELRRKLEAQRGRMLGLAGDRAQLDVLQRDIDSARAAYDAVTQRLSAMRLQSLAPTTNVRQLDVASPPGRPSSPKVSMRVLLGLILGTMLAIGTALAVEWWRPRVRTRAGIVAALGVPVLAQIDFAKSRVGTMLLTGPDR